MFKTLTTVCGKNSKAALFLRLRPPFTLIRHENGAFKKLSSYLKNLKTPLFRVSVHRKHLQNGAFSKRIFLRWEMWFPSAPEFLQTQLTTDDRGMFRFKFLWCGVRMESTWCVFKAKPPFSNFSCTVWTGPGFYYDISAIISKATSRMPIT